MNTIHYAAAVLAASLALGAASAQAAILGPTPYLSVADSPIASGFSGFVLEDLEDGAFNTPGMSVLETHCITNTNCFIGTIIDSVGNGGNPALGHSLWSGSGQVTVVFDANVLGSLPVAAGLVWTDGLNPIRFEAFDQNGNSLGVATGTHANNSFNGETDEDRFYGATNPGGISMLRISNPPAIEVDHFQFAFAAPTGGVPEPATWAMMLLGLAGAGAMLRRSRQAAQA
jgi:hypothetical protein